MKIEKFNKINEEYNGNSYYIIKNYINTPFGDNFYIIPDEEEYEQNYDSSDLKSVVEFLIENENEYNGQLKIVKVTEDELEDSDIEKIKNKIKLENNSKKYNL